jgi:hypothetical protein
MRRGSENVMICTWKVARPPSCHNMILSFWREISLSLATLILLEGNLLKPGN